MSVHYVHVGQSALQKRLHLLNIEGISHFFSRLTTRDQKQILIRDSIDENDLRTLRTIFREDSAWLTESIIDSVGSTAAPTAPPGAPRLHALVSREGVQACLRDARGVCAGRGM